MKKYFVLMALALFLCASFAGVLVASEGSDHLFVGAKKCKMCHNSAKSGKQYTIWAEGPHAGAYATLATEKALEIAKGMEIEDPQKSEKCLSCHAPSHAVKAELKDKKWDITEGVSCEDCHGAGSAYQKMSVMKDISAGKVKGADHGLITPDEALCKKCHNEKSPTYKPFKFEERVKAIAHKKPAAAE